MFYDLTPAFALLVAAVVAVGGCLVLTRLVLLAAARLMPGADTSEVELLALGLRPQRRSAPPRD
jgi:hypothetical protein